MNIDMYRELRRAIVARQTAARCAAKDDTMNQKLQNALRPLARLDDEYRARLAAGLRTAEQQNRPIGDEPAPVLAAKNAIWADARARAEAEAHAWRDARIAEVRQAVAAAAAAVQAEIAPARHRVRMARHRQVPAHVDAAVAGILPEANSAQDVIGLYADALAAGDADAAHAIVRRARAWADADGRRDRDAADIAHWHRQRIAEIGGDDARAVADALADIADAQRQAGAPMTQTEHADTAATLHMAPQFVPGLPAKE
jgi:hypothetical protein